MESKNINLEKIKELLYK